jgi:CelD/BcsL family acetyltransferase involved in cellulose biosynthesis
MNESSAADLRIEHVGDIAGLRALAPDWDALLEESATSSVFLRHAWIANWWEVFGGPFRLHVLVARDAEGEILGIAPLMTGPGPGRLRGRLDHLMLIGQQGETLAEHLDLIVRRGADDDVVHCLAEAMLELEDRWDVLLFERVPATSPHLGICEGVLRAAGCEAACVRPQASPYLPLPESWDALLGSKSRNFRRQWKNSYNRLAREGEVRLRIAGRDLPLAEAFDELVALHRARWGPGEGGFETEAYLAFHRRLSQAFEAEGALVLALLEVGGRRVAARYDFLHGGKVWCFQGGWLPEFESMRAGTVLTGLVLEWAIENGCREYDFLSGEDDYKRRWATAERTLVDLEAFANRARVRWVRRLARVKDVVRRLFGRR